jgi:prepilin-type N-terminal cleavage/methylation domain-containing protein
MYSSYQYKKHRAFTLAEILITLLIIGVISSIVIPGIIQDTQQVELKTAWKKAYSDFSQSFTRVKMDNAGTLKGLFGGDNPEAHNTILNTFAGYMNFTKMCYSGYIVSSPNTTDKCWHSTSGSLAAKFMDGSIFDGYGNDYGHATSGILSNGSLIVFYGSSLECNFSGYCTSVMIDINGFKKPNVVGKDIFRISMLETKVIPWGAQGYGYENDCNTNPPSGTGWGCSAKYLY